MKVLLHTCCGPCSIYPLEILKEKNYFVMGYFYRDNIHPFQECIRREDNLKEYSEKIDLKVIYQEGYNIEVFFRDIAFREKERCKICYYKRLRQTALVAKKGKFDYFSTTLLYSKFQNHELIKETGISVGKEVGVKFLYEDFRPGWKDGIEQSKEMGMYRQNYCGCIFSEKDRFYKKTKS
ncbi:MAG: epoxyqueuosine reductase QueH [Desulfobacterales bacterium]|nr:epoxyqueuosine reductase QueH [Desulfobacterales bacterium]